MDIYLITLEILFCLPGEYKKDELLESARYVFLWTHLELGYFFITL